MEAVVSRRLRARDEHKKVDPETIRVRKERRKTNAEYQKDYRQRIKENKELYKSYREFETLRVKHIKANWTEDQKKRYNSKAKIRNRRYREKKKREEVFTVNRTQTRKATETQREKWRMAKKEQRDQMNPQKRRRINEKRREAYALKQMAKKPKPSSTIIVQNEDSLPPQTISSSSSAGFPSACAKRKAISRSLRVLPKDAEKFADVMSNIIKKTTPKRKAALQKRCITSPNAKKRLEFLENTQMGIRNKLEELKKRRSIKDNKLRRILHSALLAKARISSKVKKWPKALNLSRKILKQHEQNEDVVSVERKERKDALQEDEVTAVREFYGKMYISREMPNQRSVKKDLQVRKCLESSMKSTYDKFIAENPTKKISYSKFASLKPTNIIPMTKHKYLQCLCEYCINIDFKVRALKSLCMQKGMPVPVGDRYDMSRSTLCPKEGEYYKKDCLDRKCAHCGVQKLEVGDLLREHSEANVSWQKWEQSEQVINGVTKKYMAMKCKNGSVVDFIDEMRRELTPFSKHLFNAYWQSKEFEYIKTNVPPKWVMMCLDFAENYCCRHQDEAQSAHWTYQQVTLHPIVAYHRCLEEDCNEVMHHSLVFVSEDHKHDYHMVHHMINKSNEFLFQNGICIEKEIHFSDGAPTQYKCKYNFMDMSMCQEDYGFEVEKHFFGSRHGKGPCDGETGVVKKSATLAVASRRAVITNAEDFYHYAVTNLTKPKENQPSHSHRKRSFFFIRNGEVNRERPMRTERIKTLKDCRSLHSFRGIQEYVVTSRERSCFCDVCIGTRTGQCQYQNLTGEWKTTNLKIRARRGRNTDIVGDDRDAGTGRVDGDAGTGIENGDAGTGRENGDAGTGREDGDANTGREDEEDGTGRENGDAGTEIENGDAGTGIENGDAGTRRENGDADTGREDEEDGTGRENGDAGTEIENGDAGTGIENGAAGTGRENGDAGTGIENGDADTGREDEEDGTGRENGDAGTEIENGDAGTGIENGAAGTGRENGDAGTGIENGDAGTGIENGDAGTGIENGDAGTGREDGGGLMTDDRDAELGSDDDVQTEDLSLLSLDSTVNSVIADMVLAEMNENSSFSINIDTMMEGLVCGQSGEANMSSPESDFRPGQFVEAYLNSDKRNKPKLFVAEIKDVSDERPPEFLLQFMVEENALYYWPSSDDYSWEPRSSIKRILSFPQLSPKSTTRKQLFYFEK